MMTRTFHCSYFQQRLLEFNLVTKFCKFKLVSCTYFWCRATQVVGDLPPGERAPAEPRGHKIGRPGGVGHQQEVGVEICTWKCEGHLQYGLRVEGARGWYWIGWVQIEFIVFMDGENINLWGAKVKVLLVQIAFSSTSFSLLWFKFYQNSYWNEVKEQFILWHRFSW